MKYFTAPLLDQCRSSDDDLSDRAAAKWEQAIAAYNARLQKIWSELPLGARRLLRHASLHDAQCLTIKTAKVGAVGAVRKIPSPRGLFSHHFRLLPHRHCRCLCDHPA